MGRPLPGIETRIVDGELQLRAASSPTFFSRYLDGAAGFDGEWWPTGDRVREDDDGYLWFEGRGDDLILSSGYRIGPFEVESALISHPAVAEAAAVAAPDAERGSVVRAIVVLQPDSEPSEELAREPCRSTSRARPRPTSTRASSSSPTSCRRPPAARSGGPSCAPVRLRPMAEIDRKRIAELTEAEQEQFRNRTAASAETYKRALAVMPNGVPSSFQVNDPWPVYLDRGKGSRVWDVDGNEYVDFHNGFGVMAIGHANPDVGAAVKARIDEGTHFAAPTDGSIAVATELARRFGLPQWRFTNSGTESTMDAVHLARGSTGRDTILKIEGSYHGHHDTVMVSVYPPLEALGDRDDPISVPYGGGVPAAMEALTSAVPFNDAEALAGALEKIGDQVAGLIMEPAMMNINIIPPREGYLQRVRELTAQYGIKLIFDEVKTGCTIAAGGATARFGVVPDMITLAKASCGGYPGGAIGMSAELGEVVADGTVKQYGTFNGNPLVMAAAEATLTKVLTDDVYESFEATQPRAARRLSGDRRRVRPARLHRGPGRQGLRRLLARAALRVPRLPDQGRRRALEARLALPHEPRHLHDSRHRGGVDPLDRALRRGPPALPGRLRGLRPRRQRRLDL